MGKIVLHTFIQAPKKVCFDLSRSIDLHKLSTAHTHEEAIAGTTTGLIGLGETVTWRAKHLGIWFELTSRVTAIDPNHKFIDEMVNGPFKSFKHVHRFELKDSGTLMTDEFEFRSPLGLLGKIADILVLTPHLKALLLKRNKVIKEYAESGRWRQLFI